MAQSTPEENVMKKTFLMIGVLLCMPSWQANATDVGTDSSPGAPAVDSSAQGGVPATASMSGGPSASLGKTRAQVNQELLDSQRNGEAARMRELFKGGS
jgi:hypothetical protein